MVFVTGKLGVNYFGKTFGVTGNYNKDEYDRAFNLWVYYTQNPNRKEKDLPIHTANDRYQQALKQFRDNRNQ